MGRARARKNGLRHKDHLRHYLLDVHKQSPEQVKGLRNVVQTSTDSEDAEKESAPENTAVAQRLIQGILVLCSRERRTKTCMPKCYRYSGSLRPVSSEMRKNLSLPAANPKDVPYHFRLRWTSVRIAYSRPYDGIYMDICLDRSLRLIIQRHFGLFGLVG